jgi:UDP-N-acetylmuramate-alanine ligase
MIGHKAENIEGAGALVISTAIKGGNPEVDSARALAIPVVRRADMLAELIRLKWTVAIAGTHGKTTTTSMVAALLDGVGLDPTVINGGVINNIMFIWIYIISRTKYTDFFIHHKVAAMQIHKNHPMCYQIMSIINIFIHFLRNIK